MYNATVVHGELYLMEDSENFYCQKTITFFTTTVECTLDNITSYDHWIKFIDIPKKFNTFFYTMYTFIRVTVKSNKSH